jgi:hypothetical protein
MLVPHGEEQEQNNAAACNQHEFVMAGLVPAIHVLFDGAVERGCPGHRQAEAMPFFERLCPGMTIL